VGQPVVVVAVVLGVAVAVSPRESNSATAADSTGSRPAGRGVFAVRLH